MACSDEYGSSKPRRGRSSRPPTRSGEYLDPNAQVFTPQTSSLLEQGGKNYSEFVNDFYNSAQHNNQYYHGYDASYYGYSSGYHGYDQVDYQGDGYQGYYDGYYGGYEHNNYDYEGYGFNGNAAMRGNSVSKNDDVSVKSSSSNASGQGGRFSGDSRKYDRKTPRNGYKPRDPRGRWRPHPGSENSGTNSYNEQFDFYVYERSNDGSAKSRRDGGRKEKMDKERDDKENRREKGEKQFRKEVSVKENRGERVEKERGARGSQKERGEKEGRGERDKQTRKERIGKESRKTKDDKENLDVNSETMNDAERDDGRGNRDLRSTGLRQPSRQDSRSGQSRGRGARGQRSRETRDWAPDFRLDLQESRGARVKTKAKNDEKSKNENESGEKPRDSDKLNGDKDKDRRVKCSRNVDSKAGPENQREHLIEDLSSGNYECMVCCDVIRREVAVWSCGECYHVFHLYCIKKWARSPSAVVEGVDSGWRCPGCQNVTVKPPNQYLCFCNKQKDPVFSPYETPHSCGEVCGKRRGENCKHCCNILCHPGPCPQCNAAVTRTCSCGKVSRSVKCGQTSVLRCEVECGRVLPCGEHYCTVVCHSGQCEGCQHTIDQYCYCGKAYRQVTCGSSEASETSYNCGELCGKKLQCGEHECQTPCHQGDCGSCSLSPDRVTLCSCGKTPLSESGVVRESCTDPIPTCDQVCGKELLCGPEVERHRCSSICHQGSCEVCTDGTMPVSCRCGSTVKEMSCKEAERYLKGEELLCTRRCNKKRECGRHRCQQICCVDSDHSCTQTCGRKLTCGLHRCEEPCHRGYCHTCWNVSFDEVTCHCGVQVLDPPVACGTKPPECHQLCQRRHDCDHPVRHNCHSDDKCPPCTELTKKWCLGNHEIRHNIPCHISDISCGMACGKPLKCGQHSCKRTCHKGECMSEEEVCEQPCSKGRVWCDHPCAVSCHPAVPCPETSCDALIQVKCVCGYRCEKVVCGAGRHDAQAKIYQQMTSSSMIGKVLYIGNSETVDISSINAKKRQLECNEECAKLERNRRLALALQIENPDLTDKLASNYNQFLKDFARANPSFVAEVEKALSELVQNAKTSKHPSRSHSFKPMKREQRKFIHEVAECYGCKTQSYDYEPVKSVVATAYKGKCWMPSMTLTAAIKRETSAPLPIPHNSTESQIRAKSASTRLSTSVLIPDEKVKTVTKPAFVDYFDMDD